MIEVAGTGSPIATAKRQLATGNQVHTTRLSEVEVDADEIEPSGSE
jgi:hypothetical protein